MTVRAALLWPTEARLAARFSVSVFWTGAIGESDAKLLVDVCLIWVPEEM